MFDRVRSYLRWVPTSRSELSSAQTTLLDGVVRTSRVESHYVEIREGQRIHALHVISREREELGARHPVASRPPLVLCHGFGTGAAIYSHSFDELARHYDVWSVDMTGCGLSTRTKARFTSAQQAEDALVGDLKAFMDKKGLRRVILVGHSFGGYTAGAFALKHPERLHKLVLLSPVGLPDPAPVAAPSTDAPSGTTAASPAAPPATSSSGTAAAAPDATSPSVAAGSPRSPVVERRRSRMTKAPLWARALVHTAASAWSWGTTPQSLIRLGGKYGRRLMHGYVDRRFTEHVNKELLKDYMFHLAAKHSTSESAITTILRFAPHHGIVAHNPLGPRLRLLRVPTVFMYGTRDWMDVQGAYSVVADKAHATVPMKVLLTPEAGHNLFLDNPRAFGAQFLASLAQPISQWAVDERRFAAGAADRAAVPRAPAPPAVSAAARRAAASSGAGVGAGAGVALGAVAVSLADDAHTLLSSVDSQPLLAAR